MNCVIYCADVGSVRSGNFGWARVSPIADADCTSIHEFVRHIANDLRDEKRVAVGFECPLFVPISCDAENLTGARDFEKGSEKGSGRIATPWSAGGGLGAMGVGLTQTIWIFEQIARQMENSSLPPAFLNWESFAKSPTGLFVWEALVTNKPKQDAAQKKISHCHDAQLGAAKFEEWRSGKINPEEHGGQVRSLIGAALLQTGWSSDISLLKEPCVVIRA